MEPIRFHPRDRAPRYEKLLDQAKAAATDPKNPNTSRLKGLGFRV